MADHAVVYAARVGHRSHPQPEDNPQRPEDVEYLPYWGPQLALFNLNTRGIRSAICGTSLSRNFGF